MGTTTPNFNLFKPNGADLVNVTTDLAANFDKIDAHGHNGTSVANTPAGTIAATNVQDAINELDGDRVAEAAARAGTNGGASIDPYVQGARPDYTGRVGTTGTGTDNRAPIQAALDAACNMNDSTYFGYLTRRSTTVKLAPGHYWVSAPSSGEPSLSIPAGVTFDCSDATLYCDYPASGTLQWSAIMLGQYSQLHIGRLVNSGKVSVPNANLVYDGVRMVLTDNHSKVIGYKDSEISGFQGAGVRGIGAWITYVKGVRITGNRFGVIASHFGDGFTYVMPGKTLVQLQNLRFATDLWIDDTIIVNCRNGGLIAGASGDAADINATSFDTYGAVVSLKNSTIENIGTYAAKVINASAFRMDSCHIEETGAGDGVLWLDTVRVVTIDNLVYNLEGRTITLPDGSSGVAFPSDFFKFANVQQFALESFYVHIGAGFNPTMRMANTTPGHFQVGGIYYSADVWAAGTIPSSVGNTAISGKYNSRHLILNGTHLWEDTTGLLRRKTSAPASAIDGTPLGNVIGPAGAAAVAYLKPTAALAETIPRATTPLSNAAAGTSGTLRLQAIALPAGTVVTGISFLSGTQAAVAPTHQWFALYDSSRVCLAVTNDDTTTAWGANTAKALNLTAPFTTTYSGLYYIGLLVTVSTTMPSWYVSTSDAVVTGLVPILGGNTADTGLTVPHTLPFTAGAITASAQIRYGYAT